MKIPDIKSIVTPKSSKVLLAIALFAVLPLCGCNIFSFLMTPGPFEEKVPPEYDLQSQQDRKILLLVECPRSAGVDFDTKDKLNRGMQRYMVGEMGIEIENLIIPTSEEKKTMSRNPVTAAQGVGAGYALVLQVDNYSLTSIQVQEYYVGDMRSRAILMDADLGSQVWPDSSSGKVAQVGIDLETKGRDMAVTRLISATVHCALRELYPCEKLKFKDSDEVMTLQDAMEIETF